MFRDRILSLAISLIVVVFVMPATSHAWDPGGTLIDDCDWGLIDTVMISDGQDGAYIAWSDRCENSQWRIFLQRIDAGGNALWPQGGIPVSEDGGGYDIQLMLADDGGVFVSWSQSGLRIQRFTSEGIPVWPEPVNCWPGSEFAIQKHQVLRPDGMGGVVTAFFEASGTTTPIFRIMGQRVNGNGDRLWGDSGVTICDREGVLEDNPQMTITSDGFCMVTWDESQEGRVFAQKMSLDGVTLWQANGISVGSDGGTQRNPHILPDESGGCFVFWRDWRTTDPGLYGQRFDGLGVAQWPANGLLVDGYDDRYPDFDIVSDGAGGTILSWQIGNVDPDLYAQRIMANGQKSWGEQARLVVVAAGGQKAPHLAQDGTGGAFLAWRDSRRGCEDIFAQHLSATGDFLWADGGVTVAAFDGTQEQHEIIAAGPDDLIAIWTGYEPPSDGLHALRIGSAGSGVTTECMPTTAAPPLRNPTRLLQAVPNPFNPRTTISFELGEPGLARLDVYDLKGRKIAQLLNESMPEGRHSIVWDGRNGRGDPVASGVYFLKLEQRGQSDVSKVALVR